MDKLNLEKSLKGALDSISSFWNRFYAYVFIILLITEIIFGLRIWQQSIYDYAWSDEKKQEFLNSQEKSVIFKEDDFKSVLSDVTARKQQVAQEKQNLKNIFKPY